MRDYAKLVGDLLAQRKMKQAALAAELGVSQGTVSRWLKGSIPETLHQEALETMERRLRGEAEEDGWIVRVDGRIGAGAAIDPDAEQVPPEGLFEIRAPFPVPPGSRAFVVSGDSMRSRYEPGDVVICWRQAADPAEVVNKEAVVQTMDGKRYLKIVRRKARAVYDLESHNASLIENVKIEWAAKVGAIIKHDEWEEVRRKAK
jgi:phage repressor protein C with HTH and peptisase S24 domain